MPASALRVARGAFLIALAAFVTATRIPAEGEGKAPSYREHLDLTYFLTPEGNRQPIQSADDWQQRRLHVIAGMERVMGPLPRPETPVALEVSTLEEVAVDDSPGLIRRKIRYHTDSPTEWVHAYLFLPVEAGPRPAILCLHQTTSIGKAEPAGLGGNPNLHYALHLARRGHVTLAPDYPSFGDSAYDFAPSRGYASGSMKAIYDNIRALDLLQSLPQVDPERIGCIGHSLGGHNALFTAVFEPRIKAVVSNCGFTRFHKYYEGRLAGWTSPRYMPRIASDFHNHPDEVPFDFPEIIACLAPRAFLASAPIHDSNFEVSGVRDCIAAARPIFELLNAGDSLQAQYPDCEHDFPEDVRQRAYEFLDQHLKP